MSDTMQQLRKVCNDCGGDLVLESFSKENDDMIVSEDSPLWDDLHDSEQMWRFCSDCGLAWDVDLYTENVECVTKEDNREQPTDHH